MATKAQYRYPDGSEYFGDWNAQGQRDGSGQMSFADGSVYVGRFEVGLCDGLGVMTFADQSRLVDQIHKQYETAANHNKYSLEV